MSLKIYEGCVIRGHNLSSFLPELQALGQQFEETAQLLAMQWLARFATHLFDQAQAGLADPDPGSPLSRAWRTLNERQTEVRRTSRRDPAVDFSAEVTVIPTGRRLLAIAYIEHPQLRELWQSQPWWEEFGYWNNSDRPDPLTAEQWRRRGAAWDKALGPSYVPAKAGYSFTLLPVDGRVLSPCSDEELETLLPNAEERVRAIGLDAYLKHHPQPSEEGESLWENVRRLRTLEASEAFLSFKTQLEQQLPELSVARLRETLSAD